MEPGSAHTLLSGVVDYAGLFPPAGLSMAEAVKDYDAARRGPDAWMLGRFVLPAARLGEFASLRQANGGDEWRLSAIVRDESAADRDAVLAFNRETARHAARVDSIEGKPESLAGIDWLATAFGRDFEVYAEVPAGDEAAEWLERVKARGLRGKVRTGGLKAEAFPSPEALVTFLDAAVRLDVPFKATAGLHHAVRGAYRLTYEPNAASAAMYGYLNVLLAAAALAAGEPRDTALQLLTQDDGSALTFDEDGVRWAGTRLPAAALDRVRARHLMSFGSCSFREPSDEFRALASETTVKVQSSEFNVQG